MKIKRIFKKITARVLIAVMLVSVFSTVDMGWNVMEVQAAEYDSNDLKEGDILFKGDSIKNSNKDKYVEVHILNGNSGTYRISSGKSWDSGDRYDTYSKNILYGHLKMSTIQTFKSSYTLNFENLYHQWTDATCTEPKKCSVVGKDGTRCTATDGDPLGHSGVKVSGKDATCTADGYNDVWKCSICNLYFSNSGCTTQIGNQSAYDGWKTGAGMVGELGHTYDQYSKSGNNIVVKCQRNSACGQQLTYTLNVNGCKGEIPYANRTSYSAATFTKSGNGTPSVGEPTVKYREVNGTNYSDSTSKPSATGNYEAYITLGEQTVSTLFSIAPGGDIYKFDKGTGNSGSMSDQLVLESAWNSDTKLKPNVFSKTGYSFEKWTSSQGDFLDEANVRQPVLSAPWTLTLTAQWKANDYTITFDNSGADIDNGTETATAKYDAPLSNIDVPEKNCSDFQGYFTATNGGGTKIYNESGTAAISKWNIPNHTTLYAHWEINHTWGYEAKDNQVIATCQNPACGFVQKLTLNTPDAVYNKSAYNQASITNDAEFPKPQMTSNIKYKGTTASGTGYSERATAPTAAGTYTASVTVKDNGQDYIAKKEFTIDKATQTATASVEGYEWGVDPLPIPAIIGVEEGATPTYYYSTVNSNADGSTWDNLTSVLLDAGTYYVYADLIETDNYKAGKTTPTSFTISGKAFDSTITKASYSGTYNKQAHSIDLSVNDDDPTLKITYATSADGTFSETKPTFTNAGDYTVYYRIKKFGYELASGSETVNIAKKGITITPNAGQSKSYGTPDPVLTYTPSEALYTGDKFTGALTYAGAAVNANVGEYAIEKGSLSAGNNYELTLAGNVKFEITQANYTQGPAIGVGYVIDYEAETLAPSNAADFEIGKKDGADINVVGSNPVVLTGELSSTPLRDIYYVRYKANSNQGSSPWSAITIPARPAAPNAVVKQETVKNKKDAEITGVKSTMEYHFDGTSEWTTVTDDKIANPDNKNAAVRIKASNENKNFTGLEKNLIFTPSEVMLTVRMGDTVVEVPYDGTVHKDQRPQTDPVAPARQVFMYWAFGGDEWKFDGESQTPDHVTKNITLVPVFGIEISGIITAQDYDSITDVSLVNGKGNHYGHKELTQQADGTYKYRVVAPAGVDYNLEIAGVKKIGVEPHDITKTQLINLNHDGGGDVIMPRTVFSSKVNREEGGAFKYTLVGGLDALEDTHGSQTQNVAVELVVSEINNDNTDDDTKKEIDAIKKTATNKAKFDFVDLTLNKKVGDGAAEDIGSTNEQLLEIIIPYNTAGKYNISVYRYHDDKVETLIPAKNIYGEYIKVGADTVTIYAKKFSTYAIGYSMTPPSSGSSDHNKSQEDDSNNSGSAPSDTPLPKKDAPAEKKPSDGLPKLIAKNTPKKDGNKEITDKNLIAFNTTGDEKDNPEKSEDVKDDPVVENDATQLEVGTSVPETEANRGSHRHHLLWLYLVLLALFFVARAITKEKANAVKISLFAGDVVVAGLLLFVVKICLLSIIVCLAEIVVASVIHLLIRSKNQTANTN